MNQIAANCDHFLHNHQRPHQGTQVDLIGAVHIAHSAYFQDLNRRFRKYDALLYELVADPEVNIPDRTPRAEPVACLGDSGRNENMLGLQYNWKEIDYKARTSSMPT